MRLVLGAMPTSLYLMAPIACVVVICWQFRANSESVMIPAMYAAGMSILRVAAPAILLAAIFALTAVIDAWVVAPRGVTMVENVKYQLRRNINIGSLREGQFHTFEFADSVATMSFKKNLGGNEFEGFFLSVKPKNKAHAFTITSQRATVKKAPDKLEISFAKGSRITLGATNNLIVVAFNSYTHTFPLKGGKAGAKRPGKTILEMDLPELMAMSQNAKARRKLVGMAKSELAKRFFVPAMALTHALLALGILFTIGPIQARMKSPHVWVALGLIVAHVSAVTIIEIVARISFYVHGLIALAILAELLVGVALLRRSGRTLQELPWPRFLRRGDRRPRSERPNLGPA